MYCARCGVTHNLSHNCSCWPTLMMPYVSLTPIPQMAGPLGNVRAEWSRQPGVEVWRFSWLADAAEA